MIDDSGFGVLQHLRLTSYTGSWIRGRLRAALALGVFVLTLSVGVPAAYAATISVTTLEDELNSDGDCSLREAIEAANTNAAVDGCAAGELAPTVDVITFSVTGTITLGSTLPSISEAVTIDGPGTATLTISGGTIGSTISVFKVGAGGTLHVRDLTVDKGDSGSGGAISNDSGGTLTVTNSTFSGGFSGGSGGAISNNGTLSITSSTFSGNLASSNGGAIRNDVGGTLTVTNSTFSGNDAAGAGGISNDGTLTVTNSTFSENTTFNPSCCGSGGAIRNNVGGTLTVTNSTFSENSAATGGGVTNWGSASVTNTTFSGNSAGFNGGGIGNVGTLAVTNTTFSGNSAGDGGGIWNFDGSTLTLQNTIVANSTSGGDCSGDVVSSGYNLIEDPSGCTIGGDTTGNITGVDPMLGPLTDNGGPTFTHALLLGSPAIDAGSPSCPPPATDQRGISRPQGAGCDIGAYEVENNPPSCASVVASPNRLFPPNHKLRPITLSGATDPDGDTVTLTVTGVTQDEPVSGLGAGDLSPDAQAGTQSNTVFVRAERSDTGDGRVYRISFTGADGNGGTCSGIATVGVPKSRNSTPVDSAPPSYNSFGP